MFTLSMILNDKSKNSFEAKYGHFTITLDFVLYVAIIQWLPILNNFHSALNGEFLSDLSNHKALISYLADKDDPQKVLPHQR